jgi:hypothetical protein
MTKVVTNPPTPKQVDMVKKDVYNAIKAMKAEYKKDMVFRSVLCSILMELTTYEMIKMHGNYADVAKNFYGVADECATADAKMEGKL